jgi:hypothetical protein
MAKNKKSKKQNQLPWNQNNNQETKQERTSRIGTQIQEKKEKEVFENDRVQAKLLELQGQQEQLEADFLEKEQQLELTRQNLLEEKQRLDQLKEELVKQIQLDEEQIRREHREKIERDIEMKRLQSEAEIHTLLSEAQEERLTMLQEANEEKQRLIKEATKQKEQMLLSAKEEAHQSLLEAHEQKLKIIEEGQNKVKALYGEKEAEIEQLLQQISAKEREIKKLEADLQMREDDLDFERDYIQEEKEKLSERLSQLSPGKLRELEHQILLLKEFEEVDKQEIASLREQMTKLRSQLPKQENRNIEQILDEMDQYQREIQHLEDMLAQYPSEYELEHLRLKARQTETLTDEIKLLRSSLQEQKLKTTRIDLDYLELEQVRTEAQALKALNQSLKDAINEQKEMLKNSEGERFKGLRDIDRAVAGYQPEISRNNINLPSLVTHVQQYGAYEEKLYYSDEAIRRFLGSMAASKLIILQGLSGTGKSSLPQMFMKSISGQSKLIPVQPSWRDRNELLGYDNDFTKVFKETEFTKAIYRASTPAEKNKAWMIILDEMNLARIEYYFADFLAVMEKKDKEDWRIPLVSDDVRRSSSGEGPQYLVDGSDLFLSQNVWFIGTANQDESTFEITDKVYDRAQVIEFIERQDDFNVNRTVRSLPLSYIELDELFEGAVNNPKNKLTASDWELLNQLDEYLRETFGVTFGNRIKAQLERFIPVYVAAGGKKEDGIDFQLARKVLRKLENRFDPQLRKDLKDLKDQLSGLFPQSAFQESHFMIDRKLKSIGG